MSSTNLVPLLVDPTRTNPEVAQDILARRTTRTSANPYNAQAGDDVIFYETSGGQVTLPVGVPENKEIEVKSLANPTSSPITVVAADGGAVNGNPDGASLANYLDFTRFRFDGQNWWEV